MSEPDGKPIGIKECVVCGCDFEAWLEPEKMCSRCQATWGTRRPPPPADGRIVKKALPE